MKELEEIMEEYAVDAEISLKSYDMMGRMLDKSFVKSRLEMIGLSDLYIYGGGYLGIQLYKAINQFVNVLNIVDKSGRLLLEIPNVPVISLDQFKSSYSLQKVIITPVRFYRSIYTELTEFVPKDKIFFLGELLGGLL